MFAQKIARTHTTRSAGIRNGYQGREYMVINEIVCSILSVAKTLAMVFACVSRNLHFLSMTCLRFGAKISRQPEVVWLSASQMFHRAMKQYTR